MIQKLIFTCVLFLFSFSSHGQKTKNDPEYFSISELQEDFNFWRRHLAEKHPIIYHYNSKERFDQYFDSVYQTINRAMTRSEFFRIIGPTTSFTKCGHSQVYSGSKINNSIMDDDHLIPVNIEWFNDTAYVTYNYTEDVNLSPGTIITEINGVSIDVIQEKSLSLLPDDGYSSAYAHFWVNKQFYFYYHLMFGLHEDYSFSTITSASEAKNVTVKGMSVDEMNAVESTKPKIVEELSEGINYAFHKNLNTSVLRVGSFFNSDYRKEHKKRYKKVIDEYIQKVIDSKSEYLVLDLRANDGGQPANPLYLLRHLMPTAFEFKHEVRKLKDKEETDSFKRSKKPFFKDGRVGVFEPFDTTFDGEIYLIVDGGATSAAGEFASVIRRYSRGKIIGTETGGNPILLTGYTLGASKKLPNTKLTFGFGNLMTLMDDIALDSGYGLIPDVIINPSIRDYFNGNTPSLEYILKEIEEIQSAQ